MEEQITRDKVNVADTWNLAVMFDTTDEWKETCRAIIDRIPQLEEFSGQLKTKEKIKKCLDLLSGMARDLEKVYVYASLKGSEDLGNSQSQQLMHTAMAVMTQVAANSAFVTPEMCALNEEFLTELKNDPDFADYATDLRGYIRYKPFVLSDKEEKLLAQATPLWRDIHDIYEKLESVDINFPNARDKDNKPHLVTHATYGELMESRDRILRKNTHKSMFGEFRSLAHTCAATLNAQVKQHHFFAKIRGYTNTLHAALAYKDIDEKVYHTLIETTEKNLDALHEYIAIRQKVLGIDDIQMWDIHCSLVPDLELKFTYEEAVDLVLKAVEPLGEEYGRVLQQGLLHDRWVDKFENKGKRSGAFSSGCYDSLPYILMNYNGTLDNVYTLIHEAGHSMHSFLSKKHQPYPMYRYTIFTAEIASTVNERLLTDYLLKHYEGSARRYVLNREIDGIRATFYRQTKFADFERKIHQHVEEGNPLSVEWISQLYAELNAKYYGDLMNANEYTPYEWSRIPHFYTNYYVFQYATGIACAYHFAEQILKGNVAPYLELLKSGGNDYPLNQLKKAGVDMLDGKVYEPLFNRFRELLNEFV